MQKYIHYCWFGGKPLPKLAKKCIKSWKKYLPDFEIVEWNEENFDVNITEFSKVAYEEKKWAFVADVARTFALKEHGGIYFDTDMLVTADISDKLEDDFFSAWESETHVAAGVIWSKEKEHPVIKDLWNYYVSTKFVSGYINQYAIPVILTRLLRTKYSLTYDSENIQKIDNGITIYPADYFYPISYLGDKNFTSNTCMIHYYDGSWTSHWEKSNKQIYRLFGKNIGQKIINGIRRSKNLTSIFKNKINQKKHNKKNRAEEDLELKIFEKEINKFYKKDYVVLYQKKWLGTSISCKELFENNLGIANVPKRLIHKYNEILEKTEIPLIIFNGFDLTWSPLIRLLKKENPNMRIKILWHGSNAMYSEEYDGLAWDDITLLHNLNIIESIGLVKKSLYDFYKLKNYNVEFVANRVETNVRAPKAKKSKNIRIGIYASENRIIKNFYNQLSAASLYDNAIIDCIPVSNKSLKFANQIDANIIGEFNPISREKLLQRMSQNDVNLYVTFVECAPMLPLESLKMGVPCITSKNHHYWEGTALEKYLVADSPDNIIEIKNKIDLALKNKTKIIKLYNEWEKENNKYSKKTVKNFLK